MWVSRGEVGEGNRGSAWAGVSKPFGEAGGISPTRHLRGEMPPRSADLELGLLGTQVNPFARPASPQPEPAARDEPLLPTLDASGGGAIGEPRSVLDAYENPLAVVLEDRGVRGAFLILHNVPAQQIDLPLAFANIERTAASLLPC